MHRFTSSEDGNLNICGTSLMITEPRPQCVLPMQEQFSKHASGEGRHGKVQWTRALHVLVTWEVLPTAWDW